MVYKTHTDTHRHVVAVSQKKAEDDTVDDRLSLIVKNVFSGKPQKLARAV